jgi:hypothetical protein
MIISFNISNFFLMWRTSAYISFHRASLMQSPIVLCDSTI